MKEQKKLKGELAKLNRNKMLGYGQTAMQEHHPKISSVKQMEVNARKEAFKNIRTKFDRQEITDNLYKNVKTAKISKSFDSKFKSKLLYLT